MSISRNNFDASWLEDGTPKTYTSLKHLPLGERAGSRVDVMPHLAEAVIDHHSHRARITAQIAKLGFVKTKSELDRKHDFGHSTKMGNFGEVVASEHLIQRHGYHMPILKLRYRDSGLPMRGEDIVAFRFDGQGLIDKVVLGEAKAVMSFSKHGKGAVKDALDRLSKCYAPHPQTLELIAEVLYGAERDEEAAAIEEVIQRVAAGTLAREHWIVLLTGDNPADPFGGIDAEAASNPPLLCVNLPLADFQKVIDEAFVAPASLEKSYAS